MKEAKRLGEVAVPCGLALVGGSGAADDFLVGREDAPQVFEHGGREGGFSGPPFVHVAVEVAHLLQWPAIL